jgi:hypothetical protein
MPATPNESASAAKAVTGRLGSGVFGADSKANRSTPRVWQEALNSSVATRASLVVGSCPWPTTTKPFGKATAATGSTAASIVASQPGMRWPCGFSLITRRGPAGGTFGFRGSPGPMTT